MLQLNPKAPQGDGFYLTGTYTLAIVRYDEGRLNLAGAIAEYTFKPNPTDIADVTQIPNTISPDHAGGFYINVNEASVKTINIRGTTGQFPGQSTISRVVGSSTGSAASAMANLLGITEKPNAYTEFIKLRNFFRRWYQEIRTNPSDFAMLFVNHKDAEFYQVLPMDFQKVRTAARPLGYGYSITLRVIAEHTPAGYFDPRLSWLDRMEQIRSQISRWRQAINQAALISSYVTTSALGSLASFVAAPVRDSANFFNNLSSGLQGLAYTANALNIQGATSVDGLKNAADKLFVQTGREIKDTFAGSSYTSQQALQNAASNMVPPTRANVAAVFSGFDVVFGSSMELLSESTLQSEVQNFDLDSSQFDQYASFLDIQLNRFLAEELAPLPDVTPQADASDASRHMHQFARVGAAGYIKGQENVLSSASLAAETTFIGNTRHPQPTVNRTEKYYSLSYIAASVLGPWARSNDARLSPELNSFRRGFLGMTDPANLAPLYRVVEVTSTDTIHTLSRKYLGSWRRWFEIALINDLRYPYISKNGGQYCRRPGDYIYVPEPNAKVSVDLVERLLNITKTHDLVDLQSVFLGFDIAIGRDGDAVFDKFDYAHITGPKAFVQELSFILEGYGGLTFDRDPGPNMRIGHKSQGASSLSLWLGVLKQWLDNDPRVNEVESLKVVQEQDILNYYMKLRFENYDSAVTLSGNVMVGI